MTAFGSARFDETSPSYEMARAVGRALVEGGFTVTTGGGTGIMEAANRGAKEVGGYSIGCNITLPLEQEPNAYLDRMVEFRYVPVRKLMLVKYSFAFVVMPGVRPRPITPWRHRSHRVRHRDGRTTTTATEPRLGGVG